MATQAASYGEFEAGAGRWPGVREGFPEEKSDPFRLRPFPNEGIYFYRKAIDNSRVLREADPEARARCWRWIATTSAGTLILTALLWPSVYDRLAGYQIEALKQSQHDLLAQRSALEVREAQLLSPGRLEELAQEEQFLDPAPDQVVFLHPKADGSLALNLPAK
jgi:hypothetical protein